MSNNSDPQQADNTPNWTEDHIEGLPREDNRIERNGSLIGDWADGKLREELAKQMSAFANTGGGNLILGANDRGLIDGGLRLSWKGHQSTKDWLEDIIPHLTDPEVIGCRVIDVHRSGNSSHIEADKGVFVIEIPDSERAPHQSTVDLRYYVRLGSKSLPAPHRLIEDIRNRVRHPKIEVRKIDINVSRDGSPVAPDT
jgi:predicted HTH transcriptional regulator